MFRAILEWRGANRTDLKTMQGDYKCLDQDNNEIDYILANVDVSSFSPAMTTEKIKTGTIKTKSFLGKSEEKAQITQYDKVSDTTTYLYVVPPHARTYNTDTVCLPTEHRAFKVDVPFEAMQHLSMIAQRTGQAIDLTKDGQSAIRETFASKTGLFADYSPKAAVLDPKASLTQNSPDHALLDAIAAKPRVLV